MITAFVPCRAGSRRVPGKNTKPFAGFDFGLLEIKLRHLETTSAVDRVMVSSNDDKVLDIASKMSVSFAKRLDVVRRPDELSVDDCLDELIQYVGQQIPEGDILWTHVTSPFFDASCYHAFIESYWAALKLGECDSAVSVDEHQTFAYRDGKVDSHNPSIKKWPRTQDLTPYLLVNSAAFLIPSDLMRTLCDRVGNRPHLVATPQMRGYDIDTPEQFEFAENLMACGALFAARSNC